MESPFLLRDWITSIADGSERQNAESTVVDDGSPNSASVWSRKKSQKHKSPNEYRSIFFASDRVNSPVPHSGASHGCDRETRTSSSQELAKLENPKSASATAREGSGGPDCRQMRMFAGLMSP